MNSIYFDDPDSEFEVRIQKYWSGEKLAEQSPGARVSILPIFE